MKTTIYILKDFHQYKKGQTAEMDTPIATHLVTKGWATFDKPKAKRKAKPKK